MKSEKINNQVYNFYVFSDKELEVIRKFKKIKNFDLALESLFGNYHCTSEVQSQCYLHVLSLAQKEDMDSLFNYLYLKSISSKSELHGCALAYFTKKISYCQTLEEYHIAKRQLDTYQKYGWEIAALFDNKQNELSQSQSPCLNNQ